MSVQYRRNFYCNTNQTQAGNGLSSSLDVNTTVKKAIIKPKDYNEMIRTLKAVHDFGESDTTTRKPDISPFTITVNGITILVNKNQFDFIEPDFYNNIYKSLQNSRREYQYNIIYGEYFDNLIEQVKNYKIPTTRYYTTTYNCCDCHGDCCDHDCCDSDCCDSDCDCGLCISCDDYACGGSQTNY